MRVRRIDQNSAVPVDAFQRFRHVHPMCSENNNVAVSRLLLGPRDGAWTKIRDKIGQCLWTSGIGYNYCMTSGYQMAAECTRHGAGAYKSYFHNHSPFFGWACDKARPSCFTWFACKIEISIAQMRMITSSFRKCTLGGFAYLFSGNPFPVTPTGVIARLGNRSDHVPRC
jgi:hypothetical protein